MPTVTLHDSLIVSPSEPEGDRQACPGYVNGLPFHAEQAHACLRKADR